MFNMFKHEDSVIFDPIWCSVIGSDISKSTGAPKKRFLEEYERDLSLPLNREWFGTRSIQSRL